jgi:hypothetical protein
MSSLQYIVYGLCTSMELNSLPMAPLVLKFGKKFQNSCFYKMFHQRGMRNFVNEILQTFSSYLRSIFQFSKRKFAKSLL